MRRACSLLAESRSGCSIAATSAESAGVSSTSGAGASSLESLLGRLSLSASTGTGQAASRMASSLSPSSSTAVFQGAMRAGRGAPLFSQSIPVVGRNARGLHTSPVAPWLMRTTRRRGVTLDRFMFNMFPRKLFAKKNKYVRNVELKHFWRKHNPLRRATNLWNLRRLNERQALTLFYGVRGLGKYKRLSPRIPFRAWNIFRLEAMLSNVVYRAGFAPTVHAARKMILQGQILRNGVRAHMPSQRCKPGDVITLASKAEVLGVLGEAMRRATAKLTAGKGAAAEGAAAAAVQ